MTRRWIGTCGFTLIELLVTTSLMALVGGASVAALSGGLRIWERAAAFGTQQQAALIAAGHFRSDLQNARRFSTIPFEGSYDRFSFAAVEPDRMEETSLSELGRLGYFFNERSHVVCRAFTPYRQLRRVRLTDQCRAILEGVTRVRFSYFGLDEERGTTGWSQQWRSARAPMAVKAEVALTEAHGRTTTQMFVIVVSQALSDDQATP